MPTVSDLLAQKGAGLYTIAPMATVLDAVHRTNQHQVGALLVMQNGEIAGIFTERDVLRRVLADQRPPEDVTVADVMTTAVICCPPEMDIEDASRIMKDHRVRHLPICDADGKVRGLISIGDLNAAYASAQEQAIHYLTDYIYGRA